MVYDTQLYLVLTTAVNLIHIDFLRARIPLLDQHACPCTLDSGSDGSLALVLDAPSLSGVVERDDTAAKSRRGVHFAMEFPQAQPGYANRAMSIRHKNVDWSRDCKIFSWRGGPAGILR